MGKEQVEDRGRGGEQVEGICCFSIDRKQMGRGGRDGKACVVAW